MLLLQGAAPDACVPVPLADTLVQQEYAETRPVDPSLPRWPRRAADPPGV